MTTTATVPLANASTSTHVPRDDDDRHYDSDCDADIATRATATRMTEVKIAIALTYDLNDDCCGDDAHDNRNCCYQDYHITIMTQDLVPGRCPGWKLSADMTRAISFTPQRSADAMRGEKSHQVRA